MSEFETDTISVIIRTASIDRIAMLDEALFSVAVQDWPSIQVVISLQSPSRKFLTAVETLTSRFFWREGISVKTLPIDIPDGQDGRARLMNSGLAAAVGRYVSFLDDDDILYQNAFTTLIEELKGSKDAIAVGGCRIARLRSVEDHQFIYHKAFPHFWGDSKFELLIENFIPVHSYILDRSRISAGTLRFRDEAIPLEDYDFLSRLADGHSFNLNKQNVPICEYRLHEKNTIWSGSATNDASPALQRARKFVREHLDQTTFSISKTEFEKLRRQAPAPIATAPPQQQLRGLDRWLTRNISYSYLKYKLRKLACKLRGQPTNERYHY